MARLLTRHVVIDGRVISNHFPGIGRYVFELVRALADRDASLRLSVLVEPDQGDRRFRLAELADRPNVRLVSVAAPVFSWRTQTELPRALALLQPDVFHATYWVTAYRPGVPTVLSVYDLIGRRVPGYITGPRGLALELALRLALRASRHVVTLSEASKRDLMQAYGLGRGDITVTYLAAAAAFRPPTTETLAELRQRFDLPRRYVLYVGINKPHKNLATLIRAFARMIAEGGGSSADDGQTSGLVGDEHLPSAASRSAGPDENGPALVIAGRWDPRYDDLRALADQLLPASRVRFLGPVDDDDLPSLYGGAAVFAFPSRYEGFGLPPLEAMACGAPVVAANGSSLPEVVDNAGLLVDADDVGGWCDALRRVLRDDALQRRLREAGLRQAQTFSWDRTAELTLAAYDQVRRRP